MPQKTIYFRERTVRGSEIVQPGFPVSVDAAEADALLEEGFADLEPPAPVETHITYDTTEVPVDHAAGLHETPTDPQQVVLSDTRVASPEPPSPYDHLVSGIQEASAGVDQGVEDWRAERDHTDQEPPVITGETVARPEAGVTEGVAPRPTHTGTRRIPPEPEARVQLLTGKSLNEALKTRGLPVGTDGAGAKRERLLADFHEKGDVDGLKAVVEKALEDA